MLSAERRERILQLVKTEVSEKEAAYRLVERLRDQFEEWIEGDTEIARDESYSEGHGDGYEDACMEFESE